MKGERNTDLYLLFCLKAIIRNHWSQARKILYSDRSYADHSGRAI
jgi:hypothetical protein